MLSGMQISSSYYSQKAILCVINRVWIEETSNCICGIIYSEGFCP
jgi:hypothetical protein